MFLSCICDIFIAGKSINYKTISISLEIDKILISNFMLNFTDV